MDTDAQSTGSERGFGEVEERQTDESTEQETSQDEQSLDSQDAEESSTGESQEQTETQDGEDQYTEKGTKLDKNPQSAVHQQLANEKRVRTQMEQVLGNPQLLQKFMEQQYGIKINAPQQEEKKAPETKKYTAQDFENVDDIAVKFNEVQETYAQRERQFQEKIAQLEQAVSGLTQQSRSSAIAEKLSSEITGLQTEKELDPKSPDFIEGLENEIVSLYHKLDFDQTTGTYRGQYSIADIGKTIVEIARKARAKGSLQAQTVIKNKSEGRVRTGTKVEEVDDNKLSPGDSIAKGVARMFR